MSILNARLGAKAPSKKQINLIKKEKKVFFTGKRIIAILLVVLIVAVGAAYAFKRAQDVKRLKDQLSQMETELSLLKMASAEYDAVENEYIRYSEAYKTNTEKETFDPRVLVDKARELIDPKGYITSMEIKGNEMTVVYYAKDLDVVYKSLNNDPEGILTYVVPVSESKIENELGEYVISTATVRLIFELPKEGE